LTSILEKPVPRAELQQDTVLKNLMVLRVPTEIVYPVSEHEWNTIQELIVGQPAPGETAAQATGSPDGFANGGRWHVGPVGSSISRRTQPAREDTCSCAQRGPVS
jgi:hypothetical protein